MRKEVKYSERECDECHKKSTFYPDNYGGKSQFVGWMVIERNNFSRIASDFSKNQTGPWDFCCYTCAIEFLRKKEKEDDLPSLGLEELDK